MSIFQRDDAINMPLAEAHGSVFALLSALHEQVELQISECGDDTLLMILVDLNVRIEAAGLQVMASVT